MSSPKAIFLMADYGHDPTETARPWKAFKEAYFDIHFATENGKMPACDEKMLSGTTGALLGAPKQAKESYKELQREEPFKTPLSWTNPAFTLSTYDIVVLPGGHEKGVRQIIDSERIHELLAAYFPLTLSSSPHRKSIAAICHGVQVLATSEHTTGANKGKSVLFDATTTSLLHFMEELIYQATRVFLGDYYKTYGANTPSVQRIVESKLEDPKTQFKSSVNMMSPFVVRCQKYNYVSGRWPGDADELGARAVSMVKEVNAI